MKIIVLGLGGRGRHYLTFSQREGLDIVAVCDNNEARMAKVVSELGLTTTQTYTDVDSLMAAGLEADACVVALPDRLHYDAAMQAMERGWHVLLEKPMAPTREECISLVETAERLDLHLVVCHVLRYAPFFEKIKEIVDSGVLGDIINIQLTENVAYWHYAHSFVRGIFNNSENATPFILAKSSHDLDIILYLTGKRCESVVSEGGLTHFTRENAPAGAPPFCLDGCPAEKTCPFFAPAFYLRQVQQVGWPSNTIAVDDSYVSRLEALKTGRYGRCVYQTDNNVNDHQSAIFNLEGGATATFNMTGFSSENTRILRIYGTRGDLAGHLDKNEIIHGDHLAGTREVVEYDTAPSIQSGHGGGDARLFKDFVRTLRGELTDNRSSARLSLESHLMAFAAEDSAASGERITLTH